jgi:hypothetical protein
MEMFGFMIKKIILFNILKCSGGLLINEFKVDSSVHIIPGFLFYCCDGVRLYLCGSAAAYVPFVHPPDDE